MLLQLSIRDIVIIEKLDIDFSLSLSVLTGETGAGKSILLDSLSLALGLRGDAGLVRQGASSGQVRAVFDVDAQHPARAIMRAHGLDDEGDVILRRVQFADGRSRVFINDQSASVTLMREIGRSLVEIHGQHAERALVDIDAHCQLLDAFAGLEAERAAVKAAYYHWRETEDALAKQKSAIMEAVREADYLRASLEELRTLAPVEGEEQDLAHRRSSMQKAEKITVEIRQVDDLFGSAHSPIETLIHVVRRLERKMTDAELLIRPVVESLDGAIEMLGRAHDAAREALRSLDFDHGELERLEERLFALRAAGRKYQCLADDLPTIQEKMAADLASLNAGEEKVVMLERALIAARAAYDMGAQGLSQQRHRAAEQLTKAVMAELPALKLGSAQFLVKIDSTPEEPGPRGIDRVEFWVCTNPGSRPGPIMKVASGGELSRFLLALKVVLADKGSAPTLIFDEIDTGAGGAVADAIGQRLQRLAERVQVLAVTHAPQVAARAHHHFLIAKKLDEGGRHMTITLHKMAEEDRGEEIARMLAGAHITDEARAAAKELLRHAHTE
ncbi:DNA repair protein RecN [Bartonella sp. DGB2]|uniref:DNA repair protein RecN n=1 Tax=Bartonella sp. DGB2 TaxID=3388426 RepID=UPI00398FD732